MNGQKTGSLYHAMPKAGAKNTDNTNQVQLCFEMIHI